MEMRDILPYMGVLLLVVLRIEIENGWFKSLADTPLADNTTAAVNLPDDGGSPLAGTEKLPKSSAQGESKKAAEERFQEKRAEAKTALRLAATLLCMRSHVSLMRAIVCIGQPCHDSPSSQVVLCKTQKGGVEWFTSKCAGAWTATALQIVGKLQDAQVLRYIGLAFPPLPVDYDCASSQDEVHIAESIFAFAVELAGAEVKEGRM